MSGLLAHTLVTAIQRVPNPPAYGAVLLDDFSASECKHRSLTGFAARTGHPSFGVSTRTELWLIAAQGSRFHGLERACRIICITQQVQSHLTVRLPSLIQAPRRSWRARALALPRKSLLSIFGPL